MFKRKYIFKGSDHFPWQPLAKRQKKTVLRGVFLLIPLTQLGLRKGRLGEGFFDDAHIAMLASIIFTNHSPNIPHPQTEFFSENKNLVKNPARVPAGQNWRICQWAPTHIHCEVVLGKQQPNAKKSWKFCRCVSSCEGTHFCFLAVIYSWKEFSPPSQGPSGRPYEGLGWDP